MSKYRVSQWLGCGFGPAPEHALKETWVVFDAGNYRVAECCATAYLTNTTVQIERANKKAKANAQRIADALNRQQ